MDNRNNILATVILNLMFLFAAIILVGSATSYALSFGIAFFLIYHKNTG